MASIKEKLAGLDKTVYKTQSESSPDIDSELSGFDSTIIKNEYGEFVLREKRFPLSQIHGISLEQLSQLNSETLELLARDRTARNLDISQLLFFDTETTGLAGGSGTYAFLVGIGYVEAKEIVIKQYFMPDFNSEAAMLMDLLSSMERFEAFVSFNGKSYDLPLLRTRFVLNRKKQNLDSKIHIDLLHPARRLWKSVYGDSSLQGLEQALLNFRRTDDIPGGMIPGKYFEFLNTKEFSPIKKIFQHNVMDILSMMAILILFDSIVRDPVKSICKFDKLGLLKSYLGVHWIDKLVEEANEFKSPSNNKNDFEIQLFKSMVQKKYCEKQDAAETWNELLENFSSFDPLVYIELAKYYEHDIREYEKAETIVDRAIKRIEFKNELDDSIIYIKELAGLKHRKERIQKKKELAYAKQC